MDEKKWPCLCALELWFVCLRQAILIAILNLVVPMTFPLRRYGGGYTATGHSLLFLLFTLYSLLLQRSVTSSVAHSHASNCDDHVAVFVTHRFKSYATVG